MFQDYALFPHKNVAANVAFGLRMQALPQQHVEARVAEMLTLVGLAGYDQRRVYDLSGGEQQRVALARSLAPGPRLLMLDEPLGSLDRALRERLLVDIRNILKQLGTTAIFVTHDQSEALAVADRVAVMNAGRLQQVDTARAIYQRPANTFVAGFIGSPAMNFLEGALSNENGGLRFTSGALDAAVPPDVAQRVSGYAGRDVVLGIRPEDI